MSYYHALGGYRNEINETKEKYSSITLPPTLKRINEPISIYRLFHILKDGEIKCKNRLKKCLDNYEHTTYNTESVYIGGPVLGADTNYDVAFNDWAGYSISLRIKDEIETNPNFQPAFKFYTPFGEEVTVVGEKRVIDSIPLSYVDAICIPVYSNFLIDKSLFARSFPEVTTKSIDRYFKAKSVDIEMIKKVLKYFDLKLPIIETFTEEEVDLSSIIDELKEIPLEFLDEYLLEKQYSIFHI